LFTLRESRRTSDPALFRLRRTVGHYGFTRDAWTLKPTDVCNVGVKSRRMSVPGLVTKKAIIK
jgi:hypothetical protein